MFYTLVKHRFLTNQSARRVLSEHAQGPIYIFTQNKLQVESFIVQYIGKGIAMCCRNYGKV